VICRMVNLSLEHGNSDASCFAYVFLGMIAGPHFDNYAGGFQFGRLGYELTKSADCIAIRPEPTWRSAISSCHGRGTCAPAVTWCAARSISRTRPATSRLPRTAATI